MQNFKKQVIANNNMKDILNESKKSSIFINGFETRPKKFKWSLLLNLSLQVIKISFLISRVETWLFEFLIWSQ